MTGPLLVTLVVELIVVQYARAAIRDALGEGVRAGTRLGAGQCQQRADEAFSSLLGGSMTRSRRLTVIVVALSALAGACSDDDDNGSADSTTAAPTAEDPTTTMETTTTSTAATTTGTTAPPETTTTTTVPPTTPTAPPPTTPEQIDWIPIVEEVYARKFGLLAAPDPARVGDVALQGNPAYEDLFQDVTEYAANGWHSERDPLTVARVDTVQVDELGTGVPLNVTLTIWINPGSGRGVVDQAGNVVIPFQSRPTAEGTLNRSSVSLYREAVDRPWLLLSETPLEPAAP